MGLYEILFLLLLGLAAGAFGGMLGIGGSVILIPGIAIVLGWPFHLAQAIAMTVNPIVAGSSALRHRKEGHISRRVVLRVLPVALLCIAAGAWLSNLIPSQWLEGAFGVFLLWVLWSLIRGPRKNQTASNSGEKSTWPRSVLTGGVTGSLAGLLGIGGGLAQVPLLHLLCRLPLKVAIGSSSAIMLFTAILGATVKDASLSNAVGEQGESLSAMDAIIGSLWLIPGAIVGGWLGARLTAIASVTVIRIVFSLLVAVAAVRLLWSAFA